MTETTFKEIVKTYREQNDLSVRGFAKALTEKFVNFKLSGQTVSRWETLPHAAPDLYFILNCVSTYDDWRKSFAIDALRAVLPEVFDSGLVTFHVNKNKQ